MGPGLLRWLPDQRPQVDHRPRAPRPQINYLLIYQFNFGVDHVEHHAPEQRTGPRSDGAPPRRAHAADDARTVQARAGLEVAGRCARCGMSTLFDREEIRDAEI